MLGFKPVSNKLLEKFNAINWPRNQLLHAIKICKQLSIFSRGKPFLKGKKLRGIAGLIEPLGRSCGYCEPIKQRGNLVDPAIKSQNNYTCCHQKQGRPAGRPYEAGEAHFK